MLSTELGSALYCLLVGSNFGLLGFTFSLIQYGSPCLVISCWFQTNFICALEATKQASTPANEVLIGLELIGSQVI